MIGTIVHTVTGDEVTNGFSNALFTIFKGAWDIVAPYAGAALVIFIIGVVVSKITGSKHRS